MKNLRNGIFAVVVGASTMLAAASPAMAQEYGPSYNTWQPGWDHGQFDRHHVILGVVQGFKPYRLWVRSRGGEVRQIDLRNGTVIRPLGATPQPGQRVAVEGRFRNGTFVARKIVLR